MKKPLLRVLDVMSGVMFWLLLLPVAIALAAMLASPFARAAYPDKPVQYIIPFPAGGESDLVARLQSELFKRKYNQSMIVVNRAGAGGALVWGQLNSLPSDGYTIAGVNLPHIVLQPLEGNVQYKTEDITAVYYYHFTPDAIVVSADSPYKTLDDLIKAARANPGKISIAGSASFSANHMATERLNTLAKVKAMYLPYKGTGDLITAVIGQHVDAAMSYLPLAIQQKGKMRTLAIASEKRHPALPDVPTFKELGFNWVDGAYRGVGVPKSTPPEIQKQVSDLMAVLNRDPDTRKRLEDVGFELVDIPVDKIADFMKTKTPVYMQDAKAAGLLK
ncbi:MAG: tripartite tricarboxylate transporter substrate binding protein [Candidatus Protistobacter heckmanni]|nr:tripartite tricarboxylate transporter substrate binding protein [Candidatus Protistobacter heckmanni]